MWTQFLKALWPERIALICPCCRKYADAEIRQIYLKETFPGDVIKCTVCNLESTRAFWSVEGFIEEMHLCAEITICQANISILPNDIALKERLDILKARLKKLKTGR